MVKRERLGEMVKKEKAGAVRLDKGKSLKIREAAGLGEDKGAAKSGEDKEMQEVKGDAGG